MTGNNEPPATVPLPAQSIIRVARLLADLDEFLRSEPTLLACFLHARGDDRARFTAYNLIDEVGFTAAWLQTQAAAHPDPQPACDPPERTAHDPDTDGQQSPRRSGS